VLLLEVNGHHRALARFIEQPDGIELFDEIKLLFQKGHILKNVARLSPLQGGRWKYGSVQESDGAHDFSGVRLLA